MKRSAKPLKQQALSKPSPGEKASPSGIKEQLAALQSVDLDDMEDAPRTQLPVHQEKALPDPFPKNPILSAVRDAFARRTEWEILTILPGVHFDDSTYARFSTLVDDLPALEQKLGKLLLIAIIQGDTDFIDGLREAMKGADEIFHRDERLSLLRQFWRYVRSLSKPLPPVGKIKTGFLEMMGKRSPKGFQLSGAQWKLLRSRTLSGHECQRAKPGPRGKRN